MSAPNQTRMLIIVAALGINALAGALVFFMTARTETDVEVQAQVAQPMVVEPVAPSSPPPIPAPTPEAEPEPEAAPEAAPLELPASSLREPDDPARAVKRAEIWQQLRTQHGLEPRADGDPAPSKSGAALLPSLDRKYIQQAIREQLAPVIRECYESALEDDPALSGKVTLRFTIIGAEDVGGIVEAAEVVDGESTLDSAFVRECMRESVLAVEFPAPDRGGQVEVRYPFEFSAKGQQP